MSVSNLMQFVSCTREYKIAIETELRLKSVSTDFRFGIGSKSVPPKKHLFFIFVMPISDSVEALKSVRYRYTEPIIRYTESQFTVSLAY